MRWDQARPSLPAGWCWATIAEIADTQLGKMLDSARQTGKFATPYLRNVNVRWHSFDFTDVKSMDIRPEERGRFTATRGDLLLTEGGEIGRAAVWDRDDNLGIQKTIHRIRPLAGTSGKYLAFAFEHMSLHGYLDDFATGVTIRHLTQQNLREVPIALPPLAEQQRIVLAAEEGLTSLERGASLVRTSTLRSHQLARRILGTLSAHR